MSRTRNRPTSMVITGASAGLGAALARAYAAPGLLLGLTGRSEARLHNIAEHCRNAGAAVRILVTDVSDAAGMRRGLAAWDAERPIDLLIANAGVFTGHGADGNMESIEEIQDLVGTNLLGLMNTVDAVLPHMRRRRDGTIALIGSLAALQPLADAPGYSASKAGAMAYGEALQEYLKPDGVRVALVYPGHIDTAQVRDHVGALPNLLTAEAAARIIKQRLDRGRTVIAFPWQLHWLIRVGRLLPWQVRAQLGQGFRFHVRKDEQPKPPT